ncbi:MAG: hypothetical protein VYC19_08225 [Pseudomonadota bacterium]|jgi:hypothetical protein|nr:hypothetical protein [Pseudomonadota bacterium]MEC7702729.1 hypothetical protein [Pseudomonadota bacterium]MEC9235855.1 hypothetical protein [Pseudomonadota bacterium]
MNATEQELNGIVFKGLAPEFAKFAAERVDTVLNKDRWFIPRLKSLSDLNKGSRNVRESLSLIYDQDFNHLPPSQVLLFLSKLSSAEGKRDLAQTFESSSDKAVIIEKAILEHVGAAVDGALDKKMTPRLYFSSMKGAYKAFQAM